MLSLPLLEYELRTRTQDGQTQVWDCIRKLWVVMTKEEHVRQLLIAYLIQELKYPQTLIAVEKAVPVGNGLVQRFDLVVYERSLHKPWLVVECKAPEVSLTDMALHQLLRYHSSLQGRYWLVTNGHQHYCADSKDITDIKWLDALPAYEL